MTARLLDDGRLLDVETARISTVYDGGGRQRSAGLELWIAGEEFPRRGSGLVLAGSSLELEGIQVHAAIFRWRLDGRDATGRLRADGARPSRPPRREERAFISDFGGVLTSPLSEALPRLSGGVQGLARGARPALAARRPRRTASTRSSRSSGARSASASSPAGSSASSPAASASTRLREVYFERLVPNAPMIAFARELRERGLRTALLTNNVREWEPLWRAKLPEIDEIFEVVVDSAFVGMRKPDPRIYELTLERLGVRGRRVRLPRRPRGELRGRPRARHGRGALRGHRAEAIAAVEAALAGPSRGPPTSAASVVRIAAAAARSPGRWWMR